MISSQSRIVVSRWAMIRQVQPRRRRLSSTIASVFGIECARGLVENQEAGVAHQGPGDLQPLSLAAGEVPPLLADDRAISAPPLEQVAVNRRIDAGLHQPLRRNHVVPERQVVAHRPLEQADLRINQLDRVDEDLARELRAAGLPS